MVIECNETRREDGRSHPVSAAHSWSGLASGMLGVAILSLMLPATRIAVVDRDAALVGEALGWRTMSFAVAVVLIVAIGRRFAVGVSR